MILFLIYYYMLMGLVGSGLINMIDPMDVEQKIVGFKQNTKKASNMHLIQEYGIKVKKELPLVNAFVCEDNADTAAFHTLAEDEEVEFIEDDYVGTTQALSPTHVDLIQGQQMIPWGVKKIRAHEIWKAFDGEGVRVGVIDTGVDRSHPDLKDNIKDVYGVLDCKNIDDDNGHGTHVSGIIAALNNDIGVVGVAPNAQIYSVKAFDNQGRGRVSDVIEALQWCIDKKVHVVNMSFGFNMQSIALKKAIKAADQNNIVLVAAAGNSGKDNSVMYPAKYPEVIAVAASDKNDNAASFSSSGPEVNIIAPGVDIPSTYIKGSYRSMSGTSMATPHVVGTIALVSSVKKLSAQKVKELILSSAKDIGLPKKTQGQGQLDAYKAVANIRRRYCEQIG